MLKKITVLVSIVFISIFFAACNNPEKPAETESTLPNEITSQAQPENTTATYDSEALFKFGMLPAKSIDGKWGFINTSGEWVISPQYTRIISDGFCANGCAIVKINGMRQVIDLSGNIIEIPGLMEIQTDDFSSCGIASAYISGYNENVYFTIENSVAVLHTDVKYNGEFTDDGLAVMNDGDGASIMNSNFEYVLEYQKNWDIQDHSNGFAVAKIYDENNRIIKIGYLNTKGEWAIDLPVKYEPQSFNRAGIAAVKTENPDYKDNRNLYHLINTSGEKICEFKAVKVNNCENSDWLRYKSTENEATTTHTYGFINSKGETSSVMLSCTTDVDFLSSVTNGRIVEERTVYDETGNLLFEAENYSFESDYHSDGYTIVETFGRKFAIVDMNGNIILKADEQSGIEEFAIY